MEDKIVTLIKEGLKAKDMSKGKAALKLFNQALKLAQQAKHKELISICQNNIGLIYYEWGNYKEALNYFSKYLQAQEDLGKKIGISKGLHNIGNVYSVWGRNNEALTYFKKSLEIIKDIGDKKDISATLNSIGLTYFALGKYNEALNYFNQALEIKEASGDKRQKAVILNNIGSVYTEWGKYDEALKYHRQSLKIHKEVNNRRGESTTLNNIGSIYSDWGNNKEALNYYQQALQIHKEINDKSGESTALNNIASIYDIWGNHEAALKYCQQSLQITQEIGDKFGEAGTLSNIGFIYGAWGKFKDAIKYYQQSLKIKEKIGDKAGISVSLDNIGSVYADMKKYKEALNYYRQSEKIRDEIGDKKGKGIVLNNIGLLNAEQEKYNEALDYYQQALQIKEEINDKSGKSTTLNNIGLVYGAWKKYKESLNYFHQSLQLCRETGNRTNECITLNNIARGYQGLKQFVKAFEHYNQAIDINEELIGRTKSEEIRTSFRAFQLFPYRSITEMLLEWYEFDQDQKHLLDALKYIELSKAREIIDKLESGRENIQMCPELHQLIEIEQKLILEINELHDILDSENRHGISRSITIEDLTEKSNELKKVRAELMQKCKDPGLIRFTKEYNPIPDFQEIFKQDKPIIWEFIYFSDEKNFKNKFKILAWDSNEIKLFESNNFEKENLLNLLHEFYKTLSSNVLNKLQANMNVLLPDELLKTLENKTKLILIPHDVLHLFPWEIIESIGLRLPIVRSYSLSILRSCMKREQQMENVLLISNPNFNLKGWNLPGADKEVNSIRQLLKELDIHYEILNHEEAKESAFIDLMNKQPGIIHFAGHGIYNVEDPWRSGILFYHPDSHDIRTVTELAIHRFKGAPLFILSACETGRSDFSKGDELIGLIRGLTLAGTTSIVATSWELSDLVAPHFMKVFYENFLQGKDVCESLFEARKKIHQDFIQPLNWGIYTLFGNPFKQIKQ